MSSKYFGCLQCKCTPGTMASTPANNLGLGETAGNPQTLPCESKLFSLFFSCVFLPVHKCNIFFENVFRISPCLVWSLYNFFHGSVLLDMHPGNCKESSLGGCKFTGQIIYKTLWNQKYQVDSVFYNKFLALALS